MQPTIVAPPCIWEQTVVWTQLVCANRPNAGRSITSLLSLHYPKNWTISSRRVGNPTIRLLSGPFMVLLLAYGVPLLACQQCRSRRHPCASVPRLTLHSSLLHCRREDR